MVDDGKTFIKITNKDVWNKFIEIDRHAAINLIHIKIQYGAIALLTGLVVFILTKIV